MEGWGMVSRPARAEVMPSVPNDVPPSNNEVVAEVITEVNSGLPRDNPTDGDEYQPHVEDGLIFTLV